MEKIEKMQKMIDYQFVDNLLTFQPHDLINRAMYGYEVFEDGVYVSAATLQLEASFRIGPCLVRGLAQSPGPLVNFKPPLIGQDLVSQMLSEACLWAKQGHRSLYHFLWLKVDEYHKAWRLMVPPQERGSDYCNLIDQSPGSTWRHALVEVRSLHSAPAEFSAEDDAAQQFFKIYAVLGRLDTHPEIRVRVGLYGYFHQIRASLVMELPEGLRDCVKEEVADGEGE